MKMWICLPFCLNITEKRTTNMAGMRKKMWTFYLFLQKQNNKRGLIQNNKTIYTEVNDANKISWLLFQGVIANIF